MSYLKISSVIELMLAAVRPALRAERLSERPTLPLSTTVRVVVSRATTFSLTLSPSSVSSTRWSASRS